MAIVVTGATGQLGRIVVRRLLELGAHPRDIVAAGRDPEKVDALATGGMRRAYIDYGVPDSLAKAFGAGDTVRVG